MLDFASTFKMALVSLKVNKMRSILTSLGIIIGVSAVIIMLAVGTGASRKIEQDMASMGSNLLMISSASVTSGGVKMGMNTKPTLTLKDSYAIAQNCPNVGYVAPYSNEVKQVAYSNQNWSTSVAGTSPEYLEIRDWKLDFGRNLTEDDVKNMAKVALIGNTVSINLFGDLNPIGKTIRIGGVPFKVVGLLGIKGENSMGQDQDDFILIPITTGQKKVFGIDFLGSVKRINVKAKDDKSIEAAQDEITELLRRRHRIGARQEDDFQVRNLTQMMETFKESARTMALLLGSIAGVSLLVGGIGIMNIMLVTVTERTKEIGIRMAIGAKPLDIRVQFLIESLLLSFIGGFLGIVFGIAGAKLIEILGSMTVYISSFSIILSFVFSGFIGVIFGYYPAYKASLLNPIDALRYE